VTDQGGTDEVGPPSPPSGGEGGALAQIDAGTPTVETDGDGRKLFEDLAACVRRHFWSPHAWVPRIVSLFYMESAIAPILSDVFYVGLGGDMGTGKTRLLALSSRITGGLRFENVSLAALARSMEHGRAVFLDEKDSAADKDTAVVIDALIRTGYQRDAPPYVRWDMKKGEREELPVYGPKMFGFRGDLETALQSRTFEVPTVGFRGTEEEGYALVLANKYPQVSDLPERLKDWGNQIRRTYPRSDLEALQRSPTFLAELRGIVKVGANRETELGATALLIARIAGVADLIAEALLAAFQARETALAANEGDYLEDLGRALYGVVKEGKGVRTVAGEEHRVPQTLIREAFDLLRRDRVDRRRLTGSEFTALRRRLGVDIVRPQNRVMWCVPKALLEKLKGEEGEDARPPEGCGYDAMRRALEARMGREPLHPNPPNPPNPLHMEEVREVREVSLPPLPQPRTRTIPGVGVVTILDRHSVEGRPLAPQDPDLKDTVRRIRESFLGTMDPGARQVRPLAPSPPTSPPVGDP